MGHDGCMAGSTDFSHDQLQGFENLCRSAGDRSWATIDPGSILSRVGWSCLADYEAVGRQRSQRRTLMAVIIVEDLLDAP